MTNRNGSIGSKNQGSPKTDWNAERDRNIGNDNKGKEYRSRMGSKSKTKHED